MAEAGEPNVNNVGKVIIGSDKNVYLLTSNVKASSENEIEKQGRDNIVVNPQGGQINITSKSDRVMQSQNATSKILRITQDGRSLPIDCLQNGGNKTGNAQGVRYYPYGANSTFGIDVDPVTGRIWTIGNEEYGDKVNLNKTANIRNGSSTSDSIVTYIDNLDANNVNGNDRNSFGHHKIIWNKNLGPTAISFVNSSRLGKLYQKRSLCWGYK